MDQPLSLSLANLSVIGEGWMDQRSMIEVADVFDINIPGHENDAYVARVRERAESWEAELHDRMMEIMEKPEKA